MKGRNKDDLMQTDFYRDLEAEGKFMLKDSEFKFWIQMTDPEFKNDDNPFIKFKLYYYENYGGKKPEWDIKEIPLDPCDNEYVDDVVKKYWYPG